ncbi:MAG: SDR family oxidoreductase [Reyranellaceae bacterium]
MLLNGRKGLVVGIANKHSIAWGCAQAFRHAGAELAVTCRNDKARPFARPPAERPQSPSRPPQHRLVGIEDVGNVAAFLVGDAAPALTGNVEHVDAGYHILG